MSRRHREGSPDHLGTKRARSNESLVNRGRSKERLRKGRSKDGLGRSKDSLGSAEVPRGSAGRSRDSSVSSSGREVRCACQYFMSDNPLPERVSLYGSRPPSRNSLTDMAKQLGDHEYEPINPPPLEKNGERRPRKEADEEETERRFLRIPRDEELVVSPEDMEVEAIAGAQDLDDDELEGRFLATTPMTNATTASRTDCDVNTSMLDSSGLEDLPLKRDSRSKKAIQSKTEQMRAQAQGIQQRIRSQAGKLRNKIRSIPRPSFQRRSDRSKSEPEEQKPRFRLPERPKFNLPERPKFNLPERPKFKMPQKPKINLPNFTKPLRERQTQPGAAPKKNLFDLDFRTYPRIFSKKSRDRGDYATSSPKLPRSATPPPAPMQPARKKGPVGQRWVNRFDDIKFADDRESEMSRRSERSESLSGFHDKDFAIADDIDNTQLPPPRALSTKSSLSHLSDSRPQSSRSSEEKHRKGVLEEIDSDQFFLRQKGISEEDIDMGKYLSKEIREAFKSPVVNALRQMDYDYDERERELEVLQNTAQNENIDPLPPTRTRSLKKQRKIKEASPVRKGNSPLTLPSEEEGAKNRYENVEEDIQSEYYKSPPPPVEYQHYKVPRPVTQPPRSKRKTSAAEETAKKQKHNGWVEVEIETSMEEVELDQIPEPLKRRKSKKRVEGPQLSQEEEPATNETTEPDYIIPEAAAPEAPRRTRSLSRGARSIHSLAQEDEIAAKTKSLSRGAKSNQFQAQDMEMKTRSLPRGPTSFQSRAQDDNVKRSVHSLAQEDSNAPKPPRRSSSKRSLHSLGQPNEGRASKQDLDSKSLHSLAQEEPIQPPKRNKSLSRGSRSFHSLTADEDIVAPPEQPVVPERTRSLSRNSKSYHSLAEDEPQPQAPERTRSLSRASKTQQPIRQEEIVVEQVEVAVDRHHYEAPPDFGYAVVDKGDKGNKPKPPRPPPPRRKKGSQSPTFNTFPRRSPIRPVRNYATLGPSRPPRKGKPKPAQSLEHIYSSDHVSQAYVDIESSLQSTHVEDLHGSNKDLQAEEVVEKMKGRPLPAPPRPPRLKAKSEEQTASMEEVEEVCVSTQTDPLPDDVCLEEDIIQEFSHEQLKIQEAFLQEMREEEERIQREIEEKRSRKIDVRVEQEQNDAKMEIIRQMDDLIQEERRLLFDQRRPDDEEDEKKKKASQLEVAEDDMGYASLDRRQIRLEEEPQPSTSFQEPTLQTILQRPETSTAHLQRSETSSVSSTVQPQVSSPTAPQRAPKPSSSTAPSPLASTTSSIVPSQVSAISSIAPSSAPAPISAPVSVVSTPQQPVYIPLVPEIINTERLHVTALEVDRLTVNELLARNIQTQELSSQALRTIDFQGNTLQIQDISSRSGNLTLGNIELPPDFIQQIIARIPWDELRPAPPSSPHSTVSEPEAVQLQSVPEEGAQQPQTPTTRRRHKQHRQRSRSHYSSDEDEDGSRQLAPVVRRPPRATIAEPTIGQLTQQLTRACTSAGLRAMRQFATQVRPPAETDERNHYIQAVACVALVLLAGLILLGMNVAKDVHHHHWDFQFPPQPPKQ